MDTPTDTDIGRAIHHRRAQRVRDKNIGSRRENTFSRAAYFRRPHQQRKSVYCHHTARLQYLGTDRLSAEFHPNIARKPLQLPHSKRQHDDRHTPRTTPRHRKKSADRRELRTERYSVGRRKSTDNHHNRTQYGG